MEETPKRFYEAMKCSGNDVWLNGFVGDLLVLSDPDGAMGLYIRIGFITPYKTKKLAQEILDRGLRFDRETK